MLIFCQLLSGGDSHYTIVALDRKATRLVINELLPTDSGPYVCNVGPVTTEFSVQVQRKFIKTILFIEKIVLFQKGNIVKYP